MMLRLLESEQLKNKLTFVQGFLSILNKLLIDAYLHHHVANNVGREY